MEMWWYLTIMYLCSGLGIWMNRVCLHMRSIFTVMDFLPSFSKSCGHITVSVCNTVGKNISKSTKYDGVYAY